jgi:hypothetical protein
MICGCNTLSSVNQILIATTGREEMDLFTSTFVDCRLQKERKEKQPYFLVKPLIEKSQ